MSRCSAPVDGHRGDSVAAAKCPVHQAKRREVVNLPAPPALAMPSAGPRFESPLPGVVGRPVDHGVEDAGGVETNSEYWATRNMTCSVGEGLAMVVRRGFAPIHCDSDGSDTEGWWLGSNTEWYLCTDPDRPEETAIFDRAGDYETDDDYVYEDVGEVNAKALREAESDEEWADARDEHSVFFPGGNRMRERVLEEVEMERFLSEIGVKRANTPALEYLREHGDLLTFTPESPEVALAKLLHPNV